MVVYPTLDSTGSKPTFVKKPFSDFVASGDGCAVWKDGNVLSAQHSSAFIDLNMDCRPDLALETVKEGKSRVLEVFYFKGGKFCFVGENVFPGEAKAFKYSSMSFVDLGGRGANDVFFVADSDAAGDDIRSHVYLNKNALPSDGDVLCVKKESTSASPASAPFENFGTMNNTHDKYDEVRQLLTK